MAKNVVNEKYPNIRPAVLIAYITVTKEEMKNVYRKRNDLYI